MDITRWSIPKSHWFFLSSQRWKSSIQSEKTRPGADSGSYHELLFAKFRLKLNKVGRTTRPFRYDLNKIPYDYVVEVGNRFKGLDLIDRVPDELWTEVHDIVQGAVINTIPKKKKCKKTKWFSDEVLQIAEKRREVKVKLLSLVRLFVTPRTVAYQAPPSMGFSRQEYWSGLPFPSPRDLPNPGIKP